MVRHGLKKLKTAMTFDAKIIFLLLVASGCNRQYLINSYYEPTILTHTQIIRLRKWFSLFVLKDIAPSHQFNI